MKLTFLGTGTSQGVPVIGFDHPVNYSTNPCDKRLRSSVLISWENIQLTIDCSPDFRTQMLANGVKHLEGILFTHEHADHTAGLDDIRPFVYLSQTHMPIYAPDRVLKALQTRFAYIFATENRYPGAPSVLPHTVTSEPFVLFNKTITPIAVMHGELPIVGYRIENLAYITDASYIAPSEIEKLSGVHTLVINALRITPHPTHFNLVQALDVIAKVAPQQAYLTHISHDMGFHHTVQSTLPKGVFLAYDNLSFEIPH